MGIAALSEDKSPDVEEAAPIMYLMVMFIGFVLLAIYIYLRISYYKMTRNQTHGSRIDTVK